MARFNGYFQGWDKCVSCGRRLIKTGNVLRHRPGGMKTHRLVVRKRRELALVGGNYRPCSACGEPCDEDEPLCWSCECGDPIKLEED